MNVVVNWTSSKLGVRLEGWQRCRSGRNSFNHRVLLISRWINVNLQHQSSSTADTHLNLDFFFHRVPPVGLVDPTNQVCTVPLVIYRKRLWKGKEDEYFRSLILLFLGEKKWRADDKFSFGLWKPCPPADAIDHTRGDWIFLPGRILKKIENCLLPPSVLFLRR